jgi:hypothetical protein
MKKQRIRFLILYALACQLQKQADFLFRLSGKADDLASATAETETSTMHSEATEDLPPPHWLMHKEANAIPAHWLRKVQQGAPTLLTKQGSPVRINTPSLAPFPTVQGKTQSALQRIERDQDSSLLQERSVSPALKVAESNIPDREIELRSEEEQREGYVDVVPHLTPQGQNSASQAVSPTRSRTQRSRQRLAVPMIALRYKQQSPDRGHALMPVVAPGISDAGEPIPASTFQAENRSAQEPTPASILTPPAEHAIPVVLPTRQNAVPLLNVVGKRAEDVLYRAHSPQRFLEETRPVPQASVDETRPVEAQRHITEQTYVFHTPDIPDTREPESAINNSRIFFLQKTQNKHIQRKNTGSKEWTTPDYATNPGEVSSQETLMKRISTGQQEYTEDRKHPEQSDAPGALPDTTWSQPAMAMPFPWSMEPATTAAQSTPQSWQAEMLPHAIQPAWGLDVSPPVRSKWPALFEREPAEKQEPEMFWQAWKRQQLLDEEQRGNRWNA